MPLSLAIPRDQIWREVERLAFQPGDGPLPGQLAMWRWDDRHGNRAYDAIQAAEAAVDQYKQLSAAIRANGELSNAGQRKRLEEAQQSVEPRLQGAEKELASLRSNLEILQETILNLAAPADAIELRSFELIQDAFVGASVEQRFEAIKQIIQEEDLEGARAVLGLPRFLLRRPFLPEGSGNPTLILTRMSALLVLRSTPEKFEKWRTQSAQLTYAEGAVRRCRARIESDVAYDARARAQADEEDAMRRRLQAQQGSSLG